MAQHHENCAGGLCLSVCEEEERVCGSVLRGLRGGLGAAQGVCDSVEGQRSESDGGSHPPAFPWRQLKGIYDPRPLTHQRK